MQIARSVVESKVAGVDVRLFTDYTKTLQQGSKVESIIETGGVPVWYLSTSMFHSKWFLVDAQFLVIGSMNWTPRAIDTNHECMLVLGQGRALAAFYSRYLMYISKGKDRAEIDEEKRAEEARDNERRDIAWASLIH